MRGVLTEKDVIHNIEKSHTPAYEYLKAVGDRLHSTWTKMESLTGRNADDVKASVARALIMEWDQAIVKAVQAGYALEDIRASVSRIKDGKRWLTFLDAAHHRIT